MEKQDQKKFYWRIKNFSSLQSERRYSAPVLIGDCKLRLLVDSKGRHETYLSLEVVDFESLPLRWGRYVKLRLTIVNHHSHTYSITEEREYCFDDKRTTMGITTLYPLYGIEEKDRGFLKNGEVTIAAEVDVFEVADISFETEILEEVSESDDLLKKTSPVKESNDVNSTKQEFSITSLEKQVGKEYMWVIKNFSFLKCCSDPFVIRGFKWHLLAECDLVSLNLHLCIADSQSLPSEVVKVRLTIVNHLSEMISILKDSEHCFDEQHPTLGFTIPYELLVEEGGFLVNGDLMVVTEVIGASDTFKESIPQRKLDVNGFHVLPSQEQSVRRIFERYPDIAVEFRAKNQHLRTTFMNFLLNLIETLYQPLEVLSNEDLVEADIAVTYLEDVGFKVDWLEKKLNQLKEKKEKELSCEARVQEMEAQLHNLKHKFETEKAELLATRARLSFHDIV